MSVALVRAVAKDGNDVVLAVRQKPNEPSTQVRVDVQQLPDDLAAALVSGEVKIEDGTGEIKMIDGQPGKRNAQVIIKADHLDRFNITGWIDTRNPNFHALQPGQHVGYRVVVRRKINTLTGEPTAPRELPILEVADGLKVRDMTYCGDPGQLPPIIPRTQSLDIPNPSYLMDEPARPATYNVNAATQDRCAWCEAPKSACVCSVPAQPATYVAGTNGKCGHGIPNCEQCPRCLGMTPPTNVQQRSSQPATNNATVMTKTSADVGELPAPSMPPQGDRGQALRRPGPRIEEAKPWVVVNTDGSLNLGSYAFDGIVECMALAVELCEEHRQRTRATNNDQELIRKVAKALMIAADVAQAAVRSDGRADANDASHKRARYCVRLASRRLEPPYEGPTSDWQNYAHALGEHAAMLMRIAVGIFEDRERANS